ncbi:EAL domain-containing protein [Achromobacter arsenitoxydans]|uniref:cyclic-guanylate-specific phosphodiesterase n=1 Tax=Achromobacter arsenitoxydans SY8 TaxID=477184 RepID=H0FCP5_9BURK|nr:cyclic diguanylate phosphodiesterase [Achromobacter arsenitoxydans]EHK64000.1 EAL domain-containing protein 6 [Achromobacter arsenitoxydans SY8]
MERVPSWRYLPVALALSLPVLACAGLTWWHAQKAQREEAESAARIVRAQTQHILAQAWEVLDRVAALTAVPCEQALPDLQRWGTLNPYFRSLILLRDDRIYCSSAVGKADYSVSEFRRWSGSLSPGGWLFTVDGTPLAPERPAILLGRSGTDGHSGVVVVDGRYVQDLLNAVATLRDYRIELQVGEGGAPIRSDSQGPWDAPSSLVYSETTNHDGRAPLIVRVKAPPEDLVQAWQQLMLTYLPAAALLGLGLAVGAYRLQANRRSFKELLRRAMRADEFQVHYQPIYGQATGQCEGVEALMRWQRPGVGYVRPDIFIAAAEEDGMIIALTRHLFALIERDMRSWTTPPGFHVGINIAAEHLSSPELVPDIERFVQNVSARQPVVVLEITERSLITDDGQARRNIDALRAQGVLVAIDDFGTGHCSLSYLQQFPVDYLKIDQGFVHAIQPSGEDAPVLDVIITLGHRLGLAVLAEGVETELQFNYLVRRGVALIQGYLFARPMPSEQFLHWYAGHAPPPGAKRPESSNLGAG